MLTASLRSKTGEEDWREKLGEEDWRRGLARRLAKRMGETLGEEDWQGEGEGEAALIKSNNPHLAGGEKNTG